MPSQRLLSQGLYERSPKLRSTGARKSSAWHRVVTLLILAINVTILLN